MKKIILKEHPDPINESNFTKNVLNVFNKDILKALVTHEADEKEINQAIINQLFNLNGPKSLNKGNFIDQALNFKISFFWRWKNLTDTYNALQHAEVFLKRYP